jgi:hypothetical protein
MTARIMIEKIDELIFVPKKKIKMEFVICKFRKNGGVNRYVFLIFQIVGLNPKRYAKVGERFLKKIHKVGGLTFLHKRIWTNFDLHVERKVELKNLSMYW